MRIEDGGEELVSASRNHLVFAYYVTGHGFGHATRVVEFNKDGNWIWPEGWEEKFRVLNSITVPNLKSNEKDKIVWITKNDQQVEFSTAQIWKDMRSNWPSVSWKEVIWFKQFNPRHAFIMWIAMQEKLMTLDRVMKWKQNTNLQCRLCKIENESHEHIFFKCNYSAKIWDVVCSFMWKMGIKNSLQEIVQIIARMKGRNNIGIVVNKLLVAAAVYYIWQERNYRVFQMKERNEEAVCSVIKDNIKAKLQSLKVRKTGNVTNIGKQWNLRWDNYKFVAE